MDSVVRSIGTQTPTEKLSFTFPDVTTGFNPDCGTAKHFSTMFSPGLDCAEEVGKLLRAIADDFARVKTRNGGAGEQSSTEGGTTPSPSWLKHPRNSCLRA